MLTRGQFGQMWQPTPEALAALAAAERVAAPSSTSLKPKRKRPTFIRKVTCMVCGDVANDHVHYGAIACYSCRAFFRRTVNAAAFPRCMQGNTCNIDKQSRKQCQACRLAKCLTVGMKSTWVQTEDDKREKKEQAMLRRLQRLKDKGGESAIKLAEELMQNKVTLSSASTSAARKSPTPSSPRSSPSPSTLSGTSYAEHFRDGDCGRLPLHLQPTTTLRQQEHLPSVTSPLPGPQLWRQLTPDRPPHSAPEYPHHVHNHPRFTSPFTYRKGHQPQMLPPVPLHDWSTSQASTTSTPSPSRPLTSLSLQSSQSLATNLTSSSPGGDFIEGVGDDVGHGAGSSCWLEGDLDNEDALILATVTQSMFESDKSGGNNNNALLLESPMSEATSPPSPSFKVSCHFDRSHVKAEASTAFDEGGDDSSLAKLQNDPDSSLLLIPDSANRHQPESIPLTVEEKSLIDGIDWTQP